MTRTYNQPYNVNTKRFLLCLNEKLQTAIHRGNNMLNKRMEIISKCWHWNKYALESYDSMEWYIRCKVESLRQSGLLQLWSWLTVIPSISINFTNRCILSDVYSTHVFTIIYVDTFHESKAIFLHLVLWRHLKYETIILYQIWPLQFFWLKIVAEAAWNSEFRKKVVHRLTCITLCCINAL